MGVTRPFQLLIKPVGADCNLRCGYCFYLRTAAMYPETSRHMMPADVLETAIRGMMQLGFPETVFSWQGGEPTLAGVEFFHRVVELEQRYGSRGQRVGNAFQTNGVLVDDAWCRLFRDYRFLVGLSLDGPREAHDGIRRDCGGGATWERVMSAAECMARYDVEFNVLCVVHAGNVLLGADLIRWFERHGFRYVQFVPCLERGLDLSVSPEAYGGFLCDTFDYWAKEGFGRVSIRDFDGMAAWHAGIVGRLCTYNRTCNQYLVIEHNGDVYPCDFFVAEEWRLGNIKDDPLESLLAVAKHKEFGYQKDKVRACRGCKWRSLCHGGCQKDRLYRGTAADPTALCQAYQRFFRHATPKLTAFADRIRGERIGGSLCP